MKPIRRCSAAKLPLLQPLADAKREEVAVRIGEIARGAEALERAAAAERDIARELRDRGEGEFSTEEAAALEHTHEDVATRRR